MYNLHEDMRPRFRCRHSEEDRNRHGHIYMQVQLIAQCGFVKGRAPELYLLLNCSKSLSKSIDCSKFVNTVYIIYVYISKTFYTVPHRKQASA